MLQLVKQTKTNSVNCYLNGCRVIEVYVNVAFKENYNVGKSNTMTYICTHIYI